MSQEVLTGEAGRRKPSLREFLASKGLVFSDPVINVVETVLSLPERRAFFMLRGPAGVGKTSLAEAVAEWLGAELVVF